MHGKFKTRRDSGGSPHFTTTMAMGGLGYQATAKTILSSRPAHASVPLTRTRRQAQAASENASLRMLLEVHCPSLLSQFRPAWWLFKRVPYSAPPRAASCSRKHHSGHLQTLYALTCDFSAVDPVSTYDRWPHFPTSCEPHTYIYALYSSQTAASNQGRWDLVRVMRLDPEELCSSL